MRIEVKTFAYGNGWHYRGVARMIQAFGEKSPGCVVSAELLPKAVDADPVWDYCGYSCKPWALDKSLSMLFPPDILIWLDASVYPVKSIQPLLDHIRRVGYYLQPTGFKIGNWVSDDMLRYFGLSRDEAMGWDEAASGVVGLDCKIPRNRKLIRDWCAAEPFFAGAHSNDKAAPDGRKYHYRNVGHVSDDPRCWGHRHDQSALAILAHQAGMTELVPRGELVGYPAHDQIKESCCLLIEGL